MLRAPVSGLLAAALTALAAGLPAPTQAAAQLAAPPASGAVAPPPPAGETDPAPAPGPEAPPSAEPEPAPTEATPRPAAQPRERSVVRQLRALRSRELIDTAAYAQARDRYTAARRTRAKLSGRRRVELSAVIATLEAITRRGELTSSRVPLAFLTLERNRQWWTTGRLLAYGERVLFKGSELVWQSYPGQGLQIQWLGTFGRANGLFAGKRYDERLRTLLDEALALASQRAGGIAFESWFTFDGGRPPWVSSLSTGTALQALARGAIRLRTPAYFTAARSALGIFGRRPPTGVRVRTAAGAHYLQYSYAPRQRIVNGFVQSLNGLRDFAALANDARGRALFAAGDAQLQAELPRADTGAWSRYAVGGRESDLGYHTLLRDVLRGLCTRTETPLYCETAQRFTDDLSQPPVLTFLDTRRSARKGRTAKVAFRLDKVSTVSLTATRAGTLVYARTERRPRGRSAYRLPKLNRAGTVTLTLRAVDLAGNAAVSTRPLRVRR